MSGTFSIYVELHIKSGSQGDIVLVQYLLDMGHDDPTIPPWVFIFGDNPGSSTPWRRDGGQETTEPPTEDCCKTITRQGGMPGSDDGVYEYSPDKDNTVKVVAYCSNCPCQDDFTVDVKVFKWQDYSIK